MTKILVIGPSWVGDTVMAQSLFKLLKLRDPDVTIDVLAPEWTFSLLNRMPEVSEAIVMPITHGELKLRTRYAIGVALRAKKYDQAIVLPNSFKSALIPWIAKIPKRTGWRGEYRYGVLNDIRHLDKTRYPLMIEQYLALGLAPREALPDIYPQPEFSVSAVSQQAVLDKHHLVLSGKPILALCAGAEFGPSKRWPEAYYAEVANKMIAAGWDVWLFGSPKDRPVTDSIMDLTGKACENLSGKLALFETIDLLSLVSGVVTNDSGLLHVAAALKKPLIAIYGSTSPAFTPPLSNTATVLKLNLDCQPCFQRVCPLVHHRCMKDILPERVLAITEKWGRL
jgi:heptosyltransferase-2